LQNEAYRRQMQLEITALGGDRMAQTSAVLLGNTGGIGSVGVWEALPHILPSFNIQRRAKRLLRANPPDLVVLIDYMMPNQSMGNFAKRELGVPVVYYIAPQEWVWSMNDQNTKEIAAFTDRLFAIFPEEANYYQRQGAPVEWVGHPFVDSLTQVPDRAEVRSRLGINPDAQVIALLPASRTQELRSILPQIIQAAKLIQAQLPQVQFWLPLSRPSFRPAILQALAKYQLQAEVTDQPSQWVIRSADLVLAKSGTANLETAILDVPQVVCYRLHPVTAFIAKHIVRVQFPFACPVNLVLMRAIVPELLQDQATAPNIAEAGLKLLTDSSAREMMRAGYAEVRRSLGEGGTLGKVARGILDLLAKSD
jgi:lipid-A-disaccharide synthase